MFVELGGGFLRVIDEARGQQGALYFLRKGCFGGQGTVDHSKGRCDVALPPSSQCCGEGAAASFDKKLKSGAGIASELNVEGLLELAVGERATERPRVAGAPDSESPSEGHESLEEGSCDPSLDEDA
jgi:hypothetical protein